MGQIDIRRKSNGEFVGGCCIRFLHQAEVDTLCHSTESGYSVETFASLEEAMEYYGDSVNRLSLPEKGRRCLAENEVGGYWLVDGHLMAEGDISDIPFPEGY